MRKTFFALATVSAIAFAAPAAAQYESANADMRTRVDQLQGRLQAGVQAGTITRAEARGLREQIRQLRALETQYSANGLTQSERQDLQGRMQALRRDLRTAEASNNGQRYGQSDWMDRNRDGYDDRDTNRNGRTDDEGYGQRYGQSDWMDRDRDGYDDRDRDHDGRWDDDVRGGSQYGSADWIDRDRDGYDDRDRDRDGRWDDDQGNYGQGGPYEEVDEACQTRSGVGGVIDTVLGRECLRVGARAPSNLSAVPYAYRNQFRDGSGYYYRSDGDRVYQIDARTRTVMRVYDID